MIKTIINILKKESFQPHLVGLITNPFYFIRRSLFLSVKNIAPQLSGRLMDFGCGRKPYRGLFAVSEYIGVDIEVSGHDHKNSMVDVFYDGKTIPIENEHFDAVFCSEVLEHIFEPDEILAEIHRTMKPGALMLITAPFCWNEHEVPYDYARYSSFGLVHLLTKHGFDIIEKRKTGSFIRVIAQLITLYIYEGLKKWGKPGLAIAMLLIAPLNLIGSILIPLFPANKSLYFNNVILARKR